MPLIFNHDVLDANPGMELREGRLVFVGGPGGQRLNEATARSLGFFFNSCRGYCLSQPGDVVVLHPGLEPCLGWAKGHFHRVGLQCADTVIWEEGCGSIAAYPDHDLSVFYFGDTAHRVRPDPRLHDVVRRFNQKNVFLRLCLELGLPVPKTWMFDSREQVHDAQAFSYPLMLKTSECTSGYGVWELGGPRELTRRLRHVEAGVPLHLQEKVAAFGFINLQYAIQDERIRRLLATEQIVEGTKHVGNVCPGRWHPWHLTDPLAERMLAGGMTGYFGFDLAVCGTPSAPHFHLLECNPRLNGATYPSLVAKRLGVLSWRARNLKTKRGRLEDIDLSGLEFDPTTRQGVVIINWGAVLHGGVGVMAAGNPEQQDMLMQELKMRL